MTKNIGIKDKLYSELKQLKGDRSFSWVIEQYMNKCEPAHRSAKIDTQAATNPALKQGEGHV